jgi:hypothetical protein
MSNENEFPDGIYYNEPREGAPDFVLGSVSIKVSEAVAWLNRTEANEKGYVNLDVKRSKAGRVYMVKNIWKAAPLASPQGAPPPVDDFEDQEIPF